MINEEVEMINGEIYQCIDTQKYTPLHMGILCSLPLTGTKTSGKRSDRKSSQTEAGL